jgi:hypothetical protein
MLAVAYANARQVKGDDPDKKGYPGPPRWGFGVGLTTPHIKKLIATKVEQRKKLDRFDDDGRKRTKRRWRELVTDKKNGGILFDRPKPTAGCSANGRGGRRRRRRRRRN